jgi:phage N-6-adenine-methyltransferase
MPLTTRVMQPAHRMQVHFSSANDEWATPQALFDRLNAVFHFTLDPCASAANAKCKRYFTIADDGLKQDWDGERVFMNPPYGRAIGDWVKKASESQALVVCLLPARTDTRWWHDYVVGHGASVSFLKGRLRFGDSTASAPFPSAIVIFTGGVLTKTA